MNIWQEWQRRARRAETFINSLVFAFALIMIGILYHIAAQPEKAWRPSDVNVSDLRGAAKYQAREVMK